MPSLISMAVASPLLELSQMDADRDRVEAAMLHAVRTRDAYLTQIVSHLIVAGGKRLRPVMTIAAAKVGSSEPVSDNVILGGISCELVHLGSLYHDDVMDEGVTRRGVETVNAKWGNLQAILAGICFIEYPLERITVNSEFSESCPMAYIDPIRTAIGTIS